MKWSETWNSFTVFFWVLFSNYLYYLKIAVNFLSFDFMNIVCNFVYAQHAYDIVNSALFLIMCL